MNILVTGATGFIGSHLCKELLQRGHTVFGLSYSRNIRNIKSLVNKKNFYLLTGDIEDVNFLFDIFNKNEIKIIFHLAAKLLHDHDLDNPFTYFNINARGTLNLLDAAYRNDIEKFIYASSMSVYSEPPEYLPVDEKHPVQPSTLYGVSKLEGELYCNVFSKAMEICVLRYGGAYGKGQPKNNAIFAFINQALNNRDITIYGNGTQSSDFVYVKDIVQGSLLALEKNKSGVYNIGSGEEMSVKDLAERIINFTNSKSEIVFTGKDTDRPFRFVLDIKKSRNDLGYSPHSVDEGLSMYISEFDGYREGSIPK